MTSPTPKTPTTHQPPLLSLPAELRNVIYRFVLVQSPRIDIRRSQTPPPEPGLLQACHQIRDEARQIYYKENNFTFTLYNLDATMALRFGDRSALHRQAKRTVKFRGNPNWTNLKVYIHACFEGRCGGAVREAIVPNDRARERDSHLVAMCFEVMRKLKARGQCWTEIEAVLEDLHYGMEATDPLWK